MSDREGPLLVDCRRLVGEDTRLHVDAGRRQPGRSPRGDGVRIGLRVHDPPDSRGDERTLREMATAASPLTSES